MTHWLLQSAAFWRWFAGSHRRSETAISIQILLVPVFKKTQLSGALQPDPSRPEPRAADKQPSCSPFEPDTTEAP